MYQERKSSKNGEGFAIAGIVLGIISLFLFWVPYLGFMPAIVALILSAVSLMQATSAGNPRNAVVMAALVISIISTIASGWWTYKATKYVTDIIENPNELKEVKEALEDFTKSLDSMQNVNIEVNVNEGEGSEVMENLEKTMEEMEDSITIIKKEK